MRRLLPVPILILSQLLAGCWEFIEPEFAEQDATTVMQVDARMNDQGDFFLSGLLVPGLDENGFVRAVVRDTLFVFGIPVAPSDTNPAGGRVYNLSTRLGPQVLARPFTIEPPVVAGVGPGPAVRWSAPLPLDPDTIRVARGADLVVRIAYDTAIADPRPTQQWFFELSAGLSRFQIGSNSPPPNRLIMPAIFIPQPSDSVVRGLFTSFQTAQIFQNEYRGVYSLTVQFDHTIIIR